MYGPGLDADLIWNIYQTIGGTSLLIEYLIILGIFTKCIRLGNDIAVMFIRILIFKWCTLKY